MYIPINFLRYDYQLQTILVGFNFFLTLCIFLKPDMVIAILLFQLILGSVQFGSSLINIARPILASTIKKWRTLHLTVSLLLLMTLVLSVVFELENSRTFGNEGSWALFWLLLLGFPQILVYTYYYLTYLDYRSRAKYVQSRIS